MPRVNRSLCLWCGLCNRFLVVKLISKRNEGCGVEDDGTVFSITCNSNSFNNWRSHATILLTQGNLADFHNLYKKHVSSLVTRLIIVCARSYSSQIGLRH